MVKVRRFGGYAQKGMNIQRLSYIEVMGQIVQSVIQVGKHLLRNKRFIFILRNFLMMLLVDILISLKIVWS